SPATTARWRTSWKRSATMGEILHAGAIAVTHGWPAGDREVENVLGVSIVLRAFPILEQRADLMPFPRIPKSGLTHTDGHPVSSHGRGAEMLFGRAFSAPILRAVREAWPGVAWLLG